MLISSLVPAFYLKGNPETNCLKSIYCSKPTIENTPVIERREQVVISSRNESTLEKKAEGFLSGRHWKTDWWKAALLPAPLTNSPTATIRCVDAHTQRLHTSRSALRANQKWNAVQSPISLLYLSQCQCIYSSISSLLIIKMATNSSTYLTKTNKKLKKKIIVWTNGKSALLLFIYFPKL